MPWKEAAGGAIGALGVFGIMYRYLNNRIEKKVEIATCTANVEAIKEILKPLKDLPVHMATIAERTDWLVKNNGKKE